MKEGRQMEKFTDNDAIQTNCGKVMWQCTNKWADIKKTV
jgi:hypothetical protein